MSSKDEVQSSPATSGLAQRFRNTFLRVFSGRAIRENEEINSISPIYTGSRMPIHRLTDQAARPVNEETKRQMRLMQIQVNRQTIIMRKKLETRLQAFEEERRNKCQNIAERAQNKNNNMKIERLRSWVGELKDVIARKMVGECRKLSVENRK